jgi:hypothetical protein
MRAGPEKTAASSHSTEPDKGNTLAGSEFGVVCVLISFRAAFMSSSTQPAAKPGTPDLAARIYVELVGRAFLRAENTAVIKPDPAELAKLSIQLAATFYKLEKIANAASGPQNVGYNVELADMAQWDK